MTKTCKRCQAAKDVLEFRARTKGSYSYRESNCRPCEKAARKEWKERNPNRERENEQRWRKRNPTARRARLLKEHYGMSLAEYARIEAEQGGVCAICRSKCTTGKKLAVDHNHDHGFIRGLLCKCCNQAIGLLRDNPGLMRRAADYIEELPLPLRRSLSA